MKLDPIGRVEKPDEMDLDPIVIPVVGYTLDREEVVEEIRFRPMQPAGAAFDLLANANADGEVPIRAIMRFLEKCVMPDDAQKFRDHLDRDDLVFDHGVMMQIHVALNEVYAARPTTLRSASSGGGQPTKRTSRAAARSQA